jgi:hypothetical protein
VRLKRVGGRGLAVVAVSIAGMALAPASGQAATTIGTGLGGPSNDACNPGRIYTQGLISGDDATTFDVPTSVITSWAVRLGAGGGQGALKVMSRDAFSTPPTVASYTVLQSSAVETIAAGTVNRFATRIPVPGGGEIGYHALGGAQQCLLDPGNLNNTQNSVINGSSTGEVGNQYTTDGGESTGRQVNIQATFEPDADADGFGDETQDRCLGVAGTFDGCAAPPPPPPDVIKPTLGGLSFGRSSFAAAKSGAAFSAKKGKKKKKSGAPTGTKVSFSLSEAGSVTFAAERKTTGRRVKGKCKTKTRKNRKKSKCTLYKKVTGSFTVPGQAGANKFTFRGRMGGKALRRGDYRLTGTAKDPANNVSVPKQKGFKIVK